MIDRTDRALSPTACSFRDFAVSEGGNSYPLNRSYLSDGGEP